MDFNYCNQCDPVDFLSLNLFHASSILTFFKRKHSSTKSNDLKQVSAFRVRNSINTPETILTLRVAEVWVALVNPQTVTQPEKIKARITV